MHTRSTRNEYIVHFTSCFELVSYECAPPRWEPGSSERGKPPGLPQQQPHASILTFESNSIPPGDVELLTPALNMGLARFTNALTTSHHPLLYLRARTPRSAHLHLPPSTRNNREQPACLRLLWHVQLKQMDQLSPTQHLAPADAVT